MLKYFAILGIALQATACSQLNVPARAETATAEPVALACLQEAIYFEAGNSSDDGKAAVAHVILNRKADPRFPDTICGVVKDGEAQGRCQFSYRCILDPTEIRWPGNHELAGKMAEAVLEEKVEDPTDGALFFHAATVSPAWFKTRPRIGNFGGNIFYR